MAGALALIPRPPMSGRLNVADVVLYQATACKVAGYAVGYGIIIALCIVASLLFVRRNAMGRFLPVVTLAIFLSSTIWLCITLRAAVLITAKTSNPSVLPRTVKLQIAHVAFLRLNCVLSDVVVVWRAWVLWPGSRSIKFVLSISMLTTVAGNIADIALVALDARQPSATGTPPNSKLWPRFLVSTLPVIIANVVATGAAAAKIWDYRSNVKSSLRHAPARVEKILLLSVESGLIYAAFWLTFFITNVVDLQAAYGVNNPYTPGAVMSYILPSIAAAYPLIIVIASVAQSSPAHTIATLLLSRMRFTRQQRTLSAVARQDVLDITSDQDSWDAVSSLVARTGPDRYRATISEHLDQPLI
ncbi:hypothetical protein BD626DRAFT_463372 [Schizophyllum amplum]|uniref:Uncharacterized protein n=1 Tax=Schizophyllum amplum TaxID=97359 RepID=A0A550C1X7_9AGAR|nr:hypothetical protein BD626DRAFT_463372 [Auriculariopsis ampla]